MPGIPAGPDAAHRSRPLTEKDSYLRAFSHSSAGPCCTAESDQFLDRLQGRAVQGAFCIFHAGGMARFLGPFPQGAGADFALACSLVKKAWERAREKGAELMYAFAAVDEAACFRSLGFTIEERVWLETFAR